MSIVATEELRHLVESEFADIVEQILLPDTNEMRILLVDGSFVDVWFSLKLEGRYSYHWERRAVDGSIYRHDNAPHRRWDTVATFPRHFHDGSESSVTTSCISETPRQALREFLSFVRSKLAAR